jgi:hypothetical protein
MPADLHVYFRECLNLSELSATNDAFAETVYRLLWPSVLVVGAVRKLTSSTTLADIIMLYFRSTPFLNIHWCAFVTQCPMR